MCVIPEEHHGTCGSLADRAALHNCQDCAIPFRGLDLFLWYSGDIIPDLW